MALPQEFIASYAKYESYPVQLVHKGTYSFALEASRSRLGESAPDLLTSNDSDIDVPFRDLGPHGPTPPKYNALSDQTLKDWLGNECTVDPLTLTPICTAAKSDPECRFVYFWAGDSRKHLKLTRRTIARILTYHQVMPAYLDFIYVFGQQDRPRDVRFSGFREQTLLGQPSPGCAIPALGRSGRQFQMCYNLKAPFLNTSPFTQWGIRQAAIHHQFDVVEGTSVWIITKGDLQLKERIERMTGPQGRPEDRSFDNPELCFKSSLAVHLLIAHWSNEGWRWYIQSLEDTIDQTTYHAVDAPRGREKARHVYTPEELQSLHGYADKIHEASWVMEANIDVLTAVRKYYESLLATKDFPQRKSCRQHILMFANQINDMICDSKMQVSRAKLLIQITTDRKAVIAQHLQTQATEVMEDLTKSMFNVSVLSQTEAIAMRIITVVTLLYLPATFVSTFFSTQVVQYQNQNNDNSNSTPPGDQESRTSFSLLALERWLEVTLPLTVVTLALAWIFFRKSVKSIRKMTGFGGSLPIYYQPVFKR